MATSTLEFYHASQRTCRSVKSPSTPVPIGKKFSHLTGLPDCQSIITTASTQTSSNFSISQCQRYRNHDSSGIRKSLGHILGASRLATILKLLQTRSLMHFGFNQCRRTALNYKHHEYITRLTRDCDRRWQAEHQLHDIHVEDCRHREKRLVNELRIKPSEAPLSPDLGDSYRANPDSPERDVDNLIMETINQYEVYKINNNSIASREEWVINRIITERESKYVVERSIFLQNQQSLQKALRMIRFLERERSLTRSAVWNVWKNELINSDKNVRYVVEELRRVIEAVAELENDRRQKEPLVGLSENEFLNRLIKFQRIQKSC